MGEEMTHPSTNLDYALYYAGHGCAVFPLIEGQKEPLAGSRGFKDATTDVGTIRRWDESLGHRFNVGIACGAVSGGLFVIDIDVDETKDEDGLRTLADWQREHGELPETMNVITGRGGLHLYYRAAATIHPSVDNTEDKHVGIDIRGEGSYVVAPPSIHPNGNAYELQEWIEDMPIAIADDNVLAFVEHVQRISVKDAENGSDADRFTLPDVLREGARDDTLFRFACSQRAANVPEDVALVAVRAYNANHCVPPLDDKTVMQKVKSAYRYPAGVTRRATRDYIDYVKECARAKLKPIAINDQRLSRLLASIHRASIAYVPEWKSFAIFNGRYWQTEGATQLIDKMVKQFAIGLSIYCNGFTDDDERKSAKRRAGRYDNYRARISLRDDLKSELVVSASMFDADPHLLNVQNGTIEFKQGGAVFRDHDARDRITHIAPVTYDPNADNALFRKTLSECVEGDADLYKFMQKVGGIICAGDTSHDFIAALGTQVRSGKDTIIGAVAAMLGDGDERGYAVYVQPETFAVSKQRSGSGPSSDRARLRGKRLIVTSEFQRHITLDVGLLKQMTGGSPITARFLNQNDQQFRLSGIIVLLTNVWPSVTDPTIFSSGRVCAIPFDRHFSEEERDLTLRERLRKPNELSGILNWCIEGWNMVQASGIERPDAVIDKTMDFLDHADPIAGFVNDILRPADDGAVTIAALYAAYCQHADGERKIGRNAFHDRVRLILPITGRAKVNGERLRNVILGYEFAEG